MRKLMFTGLLLTLAVSWLIAGNVQGTVTDVDTGEAVAGATVRFVFNGECEVLSRNGNGQHHGQGNGGGNGHNIITTVTDENGYYLLEDLTDGIYTGIALKKGEYPSVRIENIEIAGDVTVDFELTPSVCEPAGLRLRSK
jgi:hypothetical protein